MPIYQYRCRTCGHEESIFDSISDPDGLKDLYDLGVGCPDCDSGSLLTRVFGFSTTTDLIGDGYYDNSVGAYITSRRQLDDHNKRASEAHTARTGVETNFVARPAADVAPAE